MVRAIFFDIDGTLVSFSTHRISDAVRTDLRRLHDRGVKLFIATGRQQQNAEDVTGGFPFDGYITVNGQHCFAGTHILRSNPIPRDSAARLAARLEQTKTPCIFLEGTSSCAINPDPRLELFPSQLDIPMPPFLPAREISDHTIYQAVAFFTKEEERQAAQAGVFQGLEVLRWHPDFVDIVAPNGGKDRGMDAILAHFGLDLSETMAFGDGENDLPMLRHAHIGVAMGNADELVKSQADYVTGSVDEDGICSALRHFGVLG